MSHWLYPANIKFYDVFAAFKENDIYWPMNSKVVVGDVIYLYLAAPQKQIGFICNVMDLGLEEASVIEKIKPFFRGEKPESKKPKLFMKLHTALTVQIDSHSQVSYHHLKENGLNGMLMGPRKLENNRSLLNYIRKSLP